MVLQESPVIFSQVQKLVLEYLIPVKSQCELGLLFKLRQIANLFEVPHIFFTDFFYLI